MSGRADALRATSPLVLALCAAAASAQPLPPADVLAVVPSAIEASPGGATAVVVPPGTADAPAVVAQPSSTPSLSVGATARAGGAPLSPLIAEALAYEHGEGVPKDPQKAAALYCQAARAGDADALFNLGWMYANGRGLQRDYDMAASLFTRAAALGHAQAAKVLSLFRQGQVSLPDCLRDEGGIAEAAPFDIVRAEVDPFADLPAYKQRIADVVSAVAPTYGIEPRFALAVIAVESNFDHLARSDKDARGLMQLIPGTAARFNVRNAFDIRENVRGGLSYLRWLLAYYRGDVRLTAAAYNAGEGAVDRYRGVPPFAETRDYVQRVTALFRRDRHPYDPRITDPSPAVAAHVQGAKEQR